MKKITNSVYSYLDVTPGTEGNVLYANTGIVIGKDGIIIIDTLASTKEAEKFFADIRKVTDKPVKYVINTHHHPDHAYGNSFFADMGVPIISQVQSREELLFSGETLLKNPNMLGFSSDFFQGTRIVPANIVFEKAMAIDLGGITVKLIYSNLHSHAKGSIIVHIPEEDVLFTADILVTNTHPFVMDGNIQEWIKTIDTIMPMNVKNIIPGHGPLSTNKDLENMKNYLSIFDEQSKKLSATEKNLEKLTAMMLEVLPKYEGGDDVVKFNLSMLYPSLAT